MYFKIQGTYFKIYALYFETNALCFFACHETFETKPVFVPGILYFQHRKSLIKFRKSIL